MRVVSLLTLRAFYERPQHADAKEQLHTWHGHVLTENGRRRLTLKADFSTASILKDSRVIFNIAGNKYGHVKSVNYAYGIVFVKFVGTHRQYDAIDAQTIEGHSWT